MIIIMIWRIAFATVLLKKPTTVATPTRKASFGVFLCMSSVKNTDKNGIIIKPKGGKKNDPTMIEIIPTRSPHFELPYFFRKYPLAIKSATKMNRVKMA